MELTVLPFFFFFLGYRFSSSVAAFDDRAVLDSSSEAGAPADIPQASQACLGAWLLPFSGEEWDLGARDPSLERNGVGGEEERKAVPIGVHGQHEGKHIRMESQEGKTKESRGAEKDTTEGGHRVSEVESQSEGGDSHREKQPRYEREGSSLIEETLLETNASMLLVETYEDRTELFLLDRNGVKVNNTLGKEEILAQDNGGKMECDHRIAEFGGTQGSSRAAPRDHGGEQAKPEGVGTLPSERYHKWRGLRLRADVRTLSIEPFVLSSARLQRSCTGEVSSTVWLSTLFLYMAW